MMTIDELKLKLENVLSPKRFRHSLNVMNTAVELAKRYNEDNEKAAIAGLLHDCARDIKGKELFKICEELDIKPDDVTRFQPELLHGRIGAKLVRIEYGIIDEDIIKAIYYHTTGCENMSMLDKIIYVADFIEPGRDFPGVNAIRKVAFEDINLAMIQSLDSTIMHVLSKGSLVHTDTINARNFLIRSAL